MPTPSVAMIPSAYKAEKLYSALPRNGEGDFTVDRASVGTRVNSSGIIEEVAIDTPRLNYLDTYKYRNLLNYSDDYSVNVSDAGILDIRSDFNPSPISNPYNGKASIFTDDTSASTTHYFSQDVNNLEDSTNYVFSIYIKPYNIDKIQLTFRNKNNSFQSMTFVFSTKTIAGNAAVKGYEELSNGWFRLYCGDTSSTGAQQTQAQVYSWSEDSSSSSYTGNGEDRFYFGGFQFEKGTAPTTYEHKLTGITNLTYDEVSICPHLLLEPSKTNVCLRSEEFDDALWSKSNMLVTSNDSVSPDGNTSADSVTDDTSNAIHYMRMSNLSISAGNVAVSVFIKDNGGHSFSLELNDGVSTFSRRFNITDQTVSSGRTGGTAIDEGIVDYGNGWYRCYVVFACAASASAYSQVVYFNGSSYTFTGTGNDGFYMWGYQVEDSDYPTSYIKTEGSTVTRLGDVANNSGNYNLFNSEEGVLYAELSAYNDGTDRRITISDGTTQNLVRIRHYSTDDSVQFGMVVGSVTQGTMQTGGSTDVEEYHKVAIKWKANDLALWVNGVEVGTDVVATMPSANTFNTLRFEGGSGSADWYGKCRDLRVYKSALTDAELTTLTTL